MELSDGAACLSGIGNRELVQGSMDQELVTGSWRSVPCLKYESLRLERDGLKSFLWELI